MSPGSLVLVSGPSSAGKTTLCRAAQPFLPRAFWHHGLDDLFFGDGLARDADGRLRDWDRLRPRVVEGFVHALRAYLDAGVDVICAHLVEGEADRDLLVEALQGADVFWVGLHVPLVELERRELARGDRRIGDARRDLETVHTVVAYDLELDGTRPPAENGRLLADAWSARQT